MKIPSRAWGFVRAGLNNSFGVRVAGFGVGGTEDNPLLNDVDAGDEAAGVEFCPVFAAQEASGALTVRTDGSLSFVGAADGTYVIPYALFTFTPGDSAAVDEGDTDVTVVVGGVAITIDATTGNAVAAGVSGVPGVSIEIAGTVGNAVAAGVAGLAEVGGSISIDGVVGNAVAAGVAGSPGVAITITGNVGNAVAAGVSGLAAIGILIDGVVGNATAAGVTGGLSLDIVVVGVVGNAAAAGVTGAVSLSGGSGADPADVWAYELAPGVSAGQYVTEIHAMLTTLTGGSVVLPVNVKQVNDKIIYGNGIPGSDVFRVTP